MRLDACDQVGQSDSQTAMHTLVDGRTWASAGSSPRWPSVCRKVARAPGPAASQLTAAQNFHPSSPTTATLAPAAMPPLTLSTRLSQVVQALLVGVLPV
jgi:hypothetical protein